MIIIIILLNIVLGTGQLPEVEPPITVYVVIAEECPICNYMGRPLARLADKYENEVAFKAVFPLKRSNYKTINQFKTKYGMEKFESILDKDQSLIKELGATVTPEVFITDSSGDVLYQGRISDAYYKPGKINHRSRQNDLDKALQNILQGNAVPKPWPKAVGCFITIYQ